MISKPKTAEITCSKCGAHGQVDLWEVIDVDAHPELRDRVQDYTIFQWICPRCGADSRILHNCLYIDNGQRFVVYLRTKGGQPHIEHVPDGFSMRIVDDQMALAEKVRLLENGYDDSAMELVKYLLLEKINQSGKTFHEIFFDSLADDGRFVFIVHNYDSGMDESVAADVRKMYRDFVSKEHVLPEGEFLEINRDWAGHVLKKRS